MPFIARSPLAYLRTAEEINTHWQQANIAAGATHITLKGGYTLAQFQVDLTTFSNKIDQTRAERFQRDIAAAQRNIQKGNVRDSLTRFRAAITNRLMGTPYASNLPTLPVLTADESTYKEPFLKMQERWRGIDNLSNSLPDFTAPLVLGNGLTIDAYTDQLMELDAAYRSLDRSDTLLETLRRERDALMPILKQRVVQYKNALIDRFGKDHPLVKSLPALSPTAGNTLKAVKLTGTWDTSTGKAALTWTSAASPDASYSVRTTGSLPYKAEDEEALATLPHSTTHFHTDTGLTTPGAEANFKVYVVTPSGNERGSNAVKVVRPPSAR
jgi:hypothetical protein